jgi:hypothetical protein
MAPPSQELEPPAIPGRFNSRPPYSSFTGRLPPALLKYQSIYAVLSSGVRKLDEQECLAYFPVVRSVIMLILDDHLEARAKKLA